jgi:ribosomal protein S1
MSEEKLEATEVIEDQAAEAEETPAIQRKSHFTGTVKKLTLAGAIVDIGQDQPGMLHRSRIQVDPVNRVEDILEVGQTIDVWIRRIDPKTSRIELTMIKPLDLEWREIKKGMVVKGTVTRLEDFGAFIEIGAERPGLVHISELTHGYIKTPSEVVKEGGEVEVKVIGVNRRKKRIRLSMKALEALPQAQRKPEPVEEDEPEEEPVPTAMEIALRQAMSRSKAEETPPAASTPDRKAKSDRNNELDDILNRTLEQERAS